MIGLAFLAVGLIWLACSAYLSFKIPRWLGIKKAIGHLAIGLPLLAILLVGPFIDEIVGMRQFEKLCAERSVIEIGAQAPLVKRAVRAKTEYFDLHGYWIDIKVQKIAYLDKDTNEVFASYKILHTSGGRIARLFLLGGMHSCSPSAPNALNSLDIDRLIQEGKK